MDKDQMLDPIEDAIEAIRNGEIIIVVDDEDRENEGDFICAAEKITPASMFNFVSHWKHGVFRGGVHFTINSF